MQWWETEREIGGVCAEREVVGSVCVGGGGQRECRKEEDVLEKQETNQRRQSFTRRKGERRIMSRVTEPWVQAARTQSLINTHTYSYIPTRLFTPRRRCTCFAAAAHKHISMR